VILDVSTGSATKVVLQSLTVRLDSCRCPMPSFSIFLEAFLSLSCSVPQLRQRIERIDRSNLPHLNPQSEQIWLVGSQRLITTNLRLNFSDFDSTKVLNSLQPCKLIILASLRFLTIPETFKSSRTITSFSLTILVESLCKKSLRVSAILLCSFAICSLVFSHRLDPFSCRANCFCLRLNRLSNLE